MIVKIKTRKTASFRQLLNYMLHHKERLFDHNNQSFLITHNLKGNSIDEWVEQYKENESYRKFRRPNTVILSHEILSWHKEERKISIDKMEEMAREYIKLRNPRGVYVAVPHTDKKHCHVHICCAGVEYHTGKSMRMSQKEFAELKKNVQDFEQARFPELFKSSVQHGRTGMEKGMAVSDIDYQIRRRTGRESDKQKIISILKFSYKKAKSKAEFFELLQEYGLQTYSRSGKTTGIVFADRKFRLSRLGLTPELLEELSLEMKRERELKLIRERKRGRELER